MRICVAVLLFFLLCPDASGQVSWSDDFSDGDLTQDPEWMGTVDRWTIDVLEDIPALRTNGVAEADTVFLATESPISFGEWQFRFAHVDVNLSIFNGARIFLIADTPTLDGPVLGYYLQFGTNNSNEVRLYRIDGDPATQRVELGRSDPILDGFDNTLDVVVSRSQDNQWQVFANGALLFEAEDDTYAFGQYFGVWAKHTASAPTNLYFADFAVSGATGPVDDQPFEITGVDQIEPAALEVATTVPVDIASLSPADISLDSGAQASSIAASTELNQFQVSFPGPVDASSLMVASLRDFAGRELVDTVTPIARWPAPGDLKINEIMYNPRVDRFDPTPDQPSYVELVNTSDETLTLRHLRWAGRIDAAGEADTLHVGRPFTSVRPDGFVVVAAEPDGDEVLYETRLYQAFPSFPWAAPDVTLLPLHRATLGLRNAGDRIALYGAGPERLDEVEYGPEWHHPGVSVTAGRALERLSIHRPSNEPQNWTTSVDEAGGTPGLPNSVRTRPPTELPDEALAVHPSPFFPEGSGEDRLAVIQYRLQQPVSSIRVRIFDRNGRLVRTLKEATLSAETGELIWDGLDDKGRRLRIGPYIVHLEAMDEITGTVEMHRAPVVLARPL